MLRNVVSRYPYEAGAEGEECLRRHADKVNAVLGYELQLQCQFAGIKVHSFLLKEISYSPIIAQAMLKKQQATAMLEARAIIVNSAVEMSTSAIAQLAERGVTLDQAQTTTLVSNLLTVICSENDVQPTLPLAAQ